MKEIEVKVLNIDKDKVESKLKEIGCELVKDEYQYNYIFDTQERRLKKQYNGYLRIRKTVNKDNSEKIKLTLKRNLKDSKFRKNIENNLNIDDVEEGTNILEALGYKLMHIGKKHRVSYKHNDILFEIDTWDKKTYPYTYLEIEVLREEDLDKAIKLLDIDRKNITKKSIEELREEINLIK